MKKMVMLFTVICIISISTFSNGQTTIGWKKWEKAYFQFNNKNHTFDIGYSPILERPESSFKGLNPPERWMAKEKSHIDIEARGKLASMSDIPPNFDLRDSGIELPPIRDQKSCGSCWAFATNGMLEILIKKQSGVDFDLSEQHLLSHNTQNYSCSGGWWASQYYLDKPSITGGVGAVSEYDSYYSIYKNSKTKQFNNMPIINIERWAYVVGQPRPTVDAIKQALINYGPVGTAVYAGPLFKAYTGGIFNGKENYTPNHAVVIIGYVDDSPTTGYWIIRNSWGTSWGESGYMRIRYGSNQIGYSSNYIEYIQVGNLPEVIRKPDLIPVLSNASIYDYSIISSIMVNNYGTKETLPYQVKVNFYLSTDGVSKSKLYGTSYVPLQLDVGKQAYVSARYSSLTLIRSEYRAIIIEVDNGQEELDKSNNRIVKFF